MKCANETVTIELKNGTSQMDTRYSPVETIIPSSLPLHNTHTYGFNDPVAWRLVLEQEENCMLLGSRMVMSSQATLAISTHPQTNKQTCTPPHERRSLAILC